MLLSLCSLAAAPKSGMDSLSVPSLRAPKHLGAGAVGAASYAASVQVRADAPTSTAAAAAARPPVHRTFRPETEAQRESRLGGGALPEQSSGSADYHEADDFGGAGPGGDDFGGTPAGLGGTDTGFGGGAAGGAVRPGGTASSMQPNKPAVHPYVKHHESFVDGMSSACAAMTAAHDDDVNSRKGVHRFAFDQRAVLIANAWMKHPCCAAACSQALLQGADAARMAALKSRFVTVDDSKESCVIVQVNSFFSAELQRLPACTCNVCKKPFRALAVDFGCSQGSHEYAARGTTQVFTNEYLDSVIAMLRRGLTFTGTAGLEALLVFTDVCPYASRLLLKLPPSLEFRSPSRHHGPQPPSRWPPRRRRAGPGPRVRE